MNRLMQRENLSTTAICSKLNLGKASRFSDYCYLAIETIILTRDSTRNWLEGLLGTFSNALVPPPESVYFVIRPTKAEYHNMSAETQRYFCPDCKDMDIKLREADTKVELEAEEKSKIKLDLESRQQELESMKKEKLEVENELKKAQDEIMKLTAELLDHLVEREKFDRAQELYKDITPLSEISEANASRKKAILTLKIKFAKAQMMNKDYPAAGKLAAEVLKEQGDSRSKLYMESFRLQYEAIRKQTESQWKKAESWLVREYEALKSLVGLWEWRLEVGDMYCDLLGDLKRYNFAIPPQGEIVEERKRRQTEEDQDTIRSTLRLARLYLLDAKNIDVNEKRSSSEYNNKEKLKALSNIREGAVPAELAENILHEIYDGGCYHISRNNWADAEIFLELALKLEKTTPGNQYLNNSLRTKLLEYFAPRCAHESTTKPLNPKAVLWSLYEMRKHQHGIGDNKTLEYGYELSQLLAQGQDDGKYEAAKIMKEIFFSREGQPRSGETLSVEFLKIAFFFGILLLKLAAPANVETRPLGDKAELYHMAELALLTVWDNKSKISSFSKEQYIDTGEKLILCLNEQQQMKQEVSPNVAREIWALSATQYEWDKKRLQLGCSIGGILRAIENKEANKVAVEILQDVWNRKANLESEWLAKCGNNLGICLMRLAKYEEGRDVMHELTNLNTVPKLPEYEYYLAYCLMALGGYDKAKPYCSSVEKQLSDKADDAEKVIWAKKALERIAKDENNRTRITTQKATISQKEKEVETATKENQKLMDDINTLKAKKHQSKLDKLEPSRTGGRKDKSRESSRTGARRRHQGV
jgi:hypothetical protein